MRLQAHLQRARGGIELRRDVAYRGFKASALMRKRDPRAHSGADVLRFARKDIRNDPHMAQVGNLEKLRALFNPLLGNMLRASTKPVTGDLISM